MRYLSLLFLGLFMYSCNKTSNVEQSETSSFNQQPQVVVTKVGNKSLEGYSLINGSNCLSCHKDNGKFIGPSYAEIAERYTEKDIEMLASKIIEGSSGVWGEVPMAAHPQMSKEEATKMVEYILTIK